MAQSRLQQEIKQNKPFRSPQHEALLSILRTADHLKRRTQHFLEAVDLTEQQYNVLRILRGAGEAGLPTLAIAERLIEHTPGITRLVDRLEAKTLVRRERPDCDRRQVYCFLTPNGRQLLASLDAPVDAHITQAFAQVPARDIQTLIQILEKVRNQN